MRWRKLFKYMTKSDSPSLAFRSGFGMLHSASLAVSFERPVRLLSESVVLKMATQKWYNSDFELRGKSTQFGKGNLHVPQVGHRPDPCTPVLFIIKRRRRGSMRTSTPSLTWSELEWSVFKFGDKLKLGLEQKAKKNWNQFRRLANYNLYEHVRLPVTYLSYSGMRILHPCPRQKAAHHFLPKIWEAAVLAKTVISQRQSSKVGLAIFNLVPN